MVPGAFLAPFRTRATIPSSPQPAAGGSVIYAATVPGDYNADGFVGAADHTFLRDNLGGNVTLPGDTTLGMVTAADYDEWRDNIGMTAASILGLPEQSAAPEPSTYFLLAVIAMVIVGRRCTFVC